MTWILLTEAQQQVIDEIERQTDPAAALVAGAFIETQLTKLIDLRFSPYPDAAVRDRVFGKRIGALNTFSNKIDMGLMLQLYPKAFFRMLEHIEKISNKFADNEKSIDFTDQFIAVRSKQLEDAIFLDDYLVMATTGLLAAWSKVPLPPKSKLARLVEQQKKLLGFAEQQKVPDEDGGVKWQIEVGETPRDRFLNGVRFVLAYFAQIKPILVRLQVTIHAPPYTPGRSPVAADSDWLFGAPDASVHPR